MKTYFGVLLVLAVVVVLLARQEQFHYPPRIDPATFVRAPLGFPRQPGDTHPM